MPQRVRDDRDIGTGSPLLLGREGPTKHWDGTDGILTIGADGLVSGYKQITAGKLTATVDIGGVDQGQNLIEAIFVSAVLGQTLTQFINNPTQVVDKTNVEWHQAYTEWALAAPKKYSA